MHTEGINETNVTAWFAEHAPSAVAPLSFELIAGGHSNLTFRVTDQKGDRWVLRRPPLFQVLESAHDMSREHRILSALQGSDVPVPVTVGFCDDEAVNDRPFYVMEFVDGTVIRDRETAEQRDSARLPVVTRSLIETLATVHRIDVDEVGLGELGRKEDYVGRQLRRWMRQFEASKTSERPLFIEVHDQLAANIPDQGRAGLVHGDYRLDNCLIGDDDTVAAVLDWELCTLGDVKTDLAQLLVYWARPGDSFTPIEVAPSTASGFPERAQLVEWYEEASGAPMTNLDFYLSFCSWRLAGILEGVYSRYVNGAMGNAQPEGGADAFVARIEALLDQAARHAEAAA